MSIIYRADLQEEGRLQGPCIPYHVFWVVLPTPRRAPTPGSSAKEWGRESGPGEGCCWRHKAQERGPTGTHQQGWWHTLGPVRSRELSTTRARLLSPSGHPPGFRGHGHTKGPDCVSMPGFSFFIE